MKTDRAFVILVAVLVLSLAANAYLWIQADRAHERAAMEIKISQRAEESIQMLTQQGEAAAARFATVSDTADKLVAECKRLEERLADSEEHRAGLRSSLQQLLDEHKRLLEKTKGRN